jgi:hypothetical protein
MRGFWVEITFAGYLPGGFSSGDTTETETQTMRKGLEIISELVCALTMTRDIVWSSVPFPFTVGFILTSHVGFCGPTSGFYRIVTV